jgi:hypothetical protein
VPSGARAPSVVRAPSDMPAPNITCAPTDDAISRTIVAVLPEALQARPYDQVTYTFVAQLAHVAPADVRRCYPTKAELVLSALRPLPPRIPRRPALACSGAEIVTRYLQFWETADNAVILRCLCAAAGTDRRLAAAIETHTIASLIAPYAASSRTTDACPRARLAVSELLGLALSRYVLCQEPLASADHETIAAWVGPALDYFLKGELGRSAPDKRCPYDRSAPSAPRAPSRASPASAAPTCAGEKRRAP